VRVVSLSVLLGGLLCGAAATCAAQAYTPPPPPLTTLPPCPADKDAKKRAKRKDCDPTVYPSETVDTKGKKTVDAAPAAPPPPGAAAADKFPYPGEQPAAAPAAKRFPFPGESAADAAHNPASSANAPETPAGKTYPYPGETAPSVPSKDSPDDVKTTDTPAGRNYSFPGEDTRNVPHDAAAEKKAAESSAGKAFPYPGENSGENPARGSGETSPAAEPKPDDSSSASSSSASSSSSSSDDAGPATSGKSSHAKNPDDDDDDDPPKLTDKGSTGRRVLKVVKPQSDADRVDEDLSVAKFYGQSGNYMGAYLRAKDAVKTQPDYPEGHFALGEAAKRLQKNDEAVAEFQAYLKLSPDGEKAKAAQKALAELQ
jgi:hypothetical protein